jgi:hypothetical protein
MTVHLDEEAGRRKTPAITYGQRLLRRGGC